MTLFTVALLQISPKNTPAENLSKGIEACKKAKALGADLALFPEVWQVGYEAGLMHFANAIELTDPFLTTFQELAKNLEMAIAITYLGKDQGKPTNSIAVTDKEGKIILTYDKVHTCEFDEPESRLAHGKSFSVVDLIFAKGQVKIGAMICFDREFPESARTLMLQGAEIILTPNSCLVERDPVLADVRLQQFRVRAFENMVGLALANYPKPKNDGHSCAFLPSGKPLLIANEEEGIFLATFDLDEIRNWQKNEVWGAKHRRPECYT
ncbi:MAG: carbon-nitrogen hydrolase family protein [Chlamydiae bacterium]|jgi:predicted amidohydrolase|nr:carbon-nitrogen hydrolase family protein [Chlamydiota bacterium]